MENDNNGNVDDPRSRQQQEAAKDSRGVESESGEIAGCSDDVNELEERNKIEENPEVILEGLPEEIKEAVLSAAFESRWTGLLPDPESFNKYDQSIQSKMLEWTDAQIKANVVDESTRQDALVDGEIRQADRGQKLSSLVLVLTIIGAIIVSIVLESAVIAGLFLGVPLATIVGNLFKPIKSNSSWSPKHKD